MFSEEIACYVCSAIAVLIGIAKMTGFDETLDRWDREAKERKEKEKKEQKSKEQNRYYSNF